MTFMRRQPCRNMIVYDMMRVLDGVLFQSHTVSFLREYTWRSPGRRGPQKGRKQTEEGRSLESFADGHWPPTQSTQDIDRAAKAVCLRVWVCSAEPISLIAPPPLGTITTTIITTPATPVLPPPPSPRPLRPGYNKPLAPSKMGRKLEKKSSTDEMIIHTNSE